MSAQTVKTVGVIGLGRMGAPIARHLAKAGFVVAGFDIDVRANEAVTSMGVRAANSPGDAAQDADLVIVVTAFEDQVEQALFGKGGVVERARPGAIVGISATISPSGMQSFANRLEQAGLIPLDIPLCRPEHAAEAGRLLIVGGGDKDAFERCRPAFSAFAIDIFHLGPVGCGEVGKMVNNLILWACLVANHESFSLGAKFGIERDALREMLLASSADNWALRERINFIDMPWPWAEKDMQIVLQEADHMRVALPLSGTIKEAVKAIKIERGDFSGALSR